jgi:hypothetical protein
VRFALDKRVALEAGVLGRIGDDEEPWLEKGRGTDGLDEGRLAPAEAQLRLEPLPLFINEADQGDRCLANLRGHTNEVIEVRFRRCVEDAVASERRQPPPFIPLRGYSTMQHATTR